MYEQAFKNIDDTLWKDAGCSSELDYIEQTSWVLFLKYLDDYESERETAAILNGETYNRILSDDYAWKTWAAPEDANGKPDFNAPKVTAAERLKQEDAYKAYKESQKLTNVFSMSTKKGKK